MKRTIICLANSKKHGGRCLAGIEVKRNENGELMLVCDENNKPKWVRPVSHENSGAVPNEQTKHLKLLDLVEFEHAGFCPEGCNSENVYYRGKTFEKTGFLNIKPSNFEKLTYEQTTLLHNTHKSIPERELDQLDHSIALIQTDTTNIRLYEKGMSQLRIEFQYHGIAYDLPVTDYDFYLAWIDDSNLLNHISNLYLCVSLSKTFEGSAHKLVAGVIGV